MASRANLLNEAFPKSKILVQQSETDPTKCTPSPYPKANIFSKMSFSWPYPLIKLGYSRQLNQEDLYSLQKNQQSGYLSEKLWKYWNEEKKKPNPSLARVLIKVYWWTYFVATVFGVLQIATKVGEALFLQLLIRYTESEDTPVYVGYLYALGMTLSSLFHGILYHHYFNMSWQTGTRAKVGLISAIYKKVFKLPLGTVSSSGKVVNLISNDVQRFEDCGPYVPFVWIGPIEALVVLGLMWRDIGLSAIFSFISIAALIPLQGFFAKRFGKIRKSTVFHRDNRIRLLSDMFNGIQVLKLYSWEDAFKDSVVAIRDNEFKSLLKSAFMKAANEAIFFASPVAISVCTFVPFVLLGGTLTPDIVFSTIAFFNIVRLTMSNFFPRGVEGISETRVSISRIQEFLLINEMEQRSIRADRLKVGEEAVVIQNGEFSWESEWKNNHGKLERSGTSNILEKPAKFNRKPTVVSSAALNAILSPEKIDKITKERASLQNINLSIRCGELVTVIGPVGSGKSSLLMAILGEINRTQGSVKSNGKFSFSSQSSWLTSGSIRENILFGQEMIQEKFDQVVNCCCLNEDFENFPDGPDTLIGDRGSSLSGGQRARVCLARALYHDADIYLLDDPLSAVDTRVGKNLFEKAIKGYLKKKAVVLVTHQLQFAHSSDRVILIEEGKIVSQGTPDEVGRAKTSFATSFKNYISHKKKGEEDKVEENQVTETKQVVVNKEAEERGLGSVGLGVYSEYLRFGGGKMGALIILPIFFMLILCQSFLMVSEWYLARWSQGGFELNERDTILIYVALAVSTILTASARSVLFFYVFLNASRNVFKVMLEKVLHSPISFFSSNPIGRILNRFAKDQALADETLPLTFMDFAQAAIMVVGSVILVAIVNPWVILAILPILPAFYFLRSRYLKVSRDIKRLESTSRSPVYSFLSSTLEGLSSIRAFGFEEMFIHKFVDYQDANTRGFLGFVMCARWFGFRLDMLCIFFLSVTCFVSVATKGDISPYLMALALSYVLQLTGLFQWATRQSTEVENLMVSVERILGYTKITQEAPSVTEFRPPENWPTKGEIKFNEMKLRYKETLPFVLRGINCVINPGEKIGVVGRTGAGKSSLTLALFRLIEPSPSGGIQIDGIDTDKIGLGDLRSRLCIIPQEPFLFKGTVRFNLDPFSKYSDDSLWRALESVELKNVVQNLNGGLEAEVLELGSNFSVGERQLFCLARAVLRQSKIIVMDECTANVDAHTDQLIQKSIRFQFAQSTVITIAHRLHTIIDYDKILVLSQGLVKEFDSAAELLRNKESIFYSMVAQTGPQASQKLIERAKEAEREKKGERKQPTKSDKVKSSGDAIYINMNGTDEEKEERKKRKEKKEKKEKKERKEKKEKKDEEKRGEKKGQKGNKRKERKEKDNLEGKESNFNAEPSNDSIRDGTSTDQLI